MPDSYRKEREHPFRKVQREQNERQLMTPVEREVLSELERIGKEAKSGRLDGLSAVGIMRLAYAAVRRAILRDSRRRVPDVQRRRRGDCK